jgi:hypothetical protein
MQVHTSSDIKNVHLLAVEVFYALSGDDMTYKAER